jgi:hypothetical protein
MRQSFQRNLSSLCWSRYPLLDLRCFLIRKAQLRLLDATFSHDIGNDVQLFVYPLISDIVISGCQSVMFIQHPLKLVVDRLITGFPPRSLFSLNHGDWAHEMTPAVSK